MKSLTDKKFQETLEKTTEKIKEDDKKVETLSIEALIKLGHMEETIEILPGMTVTLHTLSDTEKAEAMRFVKDDTLEMPVAQRMEALKKPVLTYAISKINNDSFTTKAEKDKLFGHLSEMSAPMVDLINLKYTEMYVQQIQQVTTGIKKK